MKNILLHFITFILFTPITAHAQVVISEVHWVGTDLSSADEWLELAAIESADISNWYITSVNSSGEEKVIATIPNTKFIQKGAYFVISNYAAADSRLPFDADVITSKVSLPNSQLYLRLYNSSGALIDAVDDGVGQPFAGSKEDGYFSMERISLYSSGEDETNWQTAMQSFTENVYGSPGAATTIASSSSSSSESSTPLPDIRITEVLANPEGKDDGKEWIELWNAGEDTVYLQEMKLQVGSKQFEFNNSSLALNKNEYLYILSSTTNLSLTNKGDTITLLSASDEVIDEFEYAETAEGVSYGILDNSLQPLCMPSAGKKNTKIVQQIIIEQQSGRTRGTGSVTLNLNAKALNGSIEYVECYWEYSDGFRSMSCNPPSHTFEDEGVFSVELRANNICGDSIVEVLHGKVYPSSSAKATEDKEVEVEDSFTSSSLSSISSSISSSATSSSSSESSSQRSYALEVELSEVYPSPNSGEDEWIEIYNPTSAPVDLSGWYIDDVADGGSNSWKIPVEYSAIKSGEYVLFYRAKTKLALNNSGDEVRLLDPNGDQKISILYGSIKKGMSYVVEGDCISEVPTPGKPNICRTAKTKVAGTSAVESTKKIAPKQSNFEKYVKESYKNLVHASALEKEEKSPLLASFYPNTVLAGNIASKQSEKANLPLELLLYLCFVVPGWYLLVKQRFKPNTRR